MDFKILRARRLCGGYIVLKSYEVEWECFDIVLSGRSRVAGFFSSGR